MLSGKGVYCEKGINDDWSPLKLYLRNYIAMWCEQLDWTIAENMFGGIRWMSEVKSCD